MRWPISWSTSMRLTKEKPQSPCSMLESQLQVALPDRVVQPELRAQRHAHLGWHVGVGGQFLERVARRQRQHGEQHHADAQQAGQRDQQRGGRM
jgi:hypothetical protein